MPRSISSMAMRRGGQAGGHDIARRYVDPADADWVLVVQPEHLDRLEHADEVLAQAVLEGHPFALDPAWDEEHFLVLHVHAALRTDAFWKLERLRLGERLGGVPT